MRRLIDRLMWRLGYERIDIDDDSFDRGIAPYDDDGCCCAMLHDGPCKDHRIIVTTDHRQAPCS